MVILVYRSTEEACFEKQAQKVVDMKGAKKRSEEREIFSKRPTVNRAPAQKSIPPSYKMIENLQNIAHRSQRFRRFFFDARHENGGTGLMVLISERLHNFVIIQFNFSILGF